MSDFPYTDDPMTDEQEDRFCEIMSKIGESRRMNEKRFWQQVSDTYDLYHGRYRHALLTDEEIREDISGFLTDIDLLAVAWHSRDKVKEGVNNDDKG